MIDGGTTKAPRLRNKGSRTEKNNMHGACIFEKLVGIERVGERNWNWILLPPPISTSPSVAEHPPTIKPHFSRLFLHCRKPCSPLLSSIGLGCSLSALSLHNRQCPRVPSRQTLAMAHLSHPEHHRPLPAMASFATPPRLLVCTG